ncbi:MAG: hypothetical protein M9929_04150 [Burkholderiaceae bacterium]|nr:hypothetical protein [Burkholderiaceae bacterium]
MNFEELLEQYKASPRRESAALVLNDGVLLKYCVVFKQVRPRRLHDWPEDNTWPALWACVHVDVEAIATLADDVPAVALRNIERIKGLRLVYPDGTIQPMVEKIIVKRINDALS